MRRAHVLGASGRSGTALCRSLLADGIAVVPLVRDPARWATTGLAGEPRRAELADPGLLRAALADAELVISCAHARYADNILAKSPPQARFCFLGSTRKFTRWPDAHANGVIAGEQAFLGSSRPGVMLHPTMIYGAEGEDNVHRLAALIGRLPAVPLPGGGRALVQPIHQDDVTRAIRAAIERPWPTPQALVIAGPTPLPYAAFVRAVAAAARIPLPRILPAPAGPLIAAAWLAARLTRLPRVGPEEVRRLLEDKAFDVRPMRTLLGFDPMPLAEGLARTFAPPHNEARPQEPVHADHQPHR